MHVIWRPVACYKESKKKKKQLEIFTSDLLDIYDISGPKLGQASTNTRENKLEVELYFIFRRSCNKSVAIFNLSK